MRSSFIFHGKCRGLNTDWSVSIACNNLPLETLCLLLWLTFVNTPTYTVNHKQYYTYAHRQTIFNLYVRPLDTYQLGIYCLLVYLFLLIACFVFNKNYVLFYIVIILLQFICRMLSLCAWSYIAGVSNIAPLQYTTTTKLNSVALVCTRTIPTERPPRAAKLVPTFADRGVSRGQRNGSPQPLISVF